LDSFAWHDSGRLSLGEERAELTALARNGRAEHRVARRANAVLLLDKGWSCQKVAEALLLDDDTVREWHDLFAASGVEGLSRFEMGGGASFLSEAQEARRPGSPVEGLDCGDFAALDARDRRRCLAGVRRRL
jgi:hypothetical protein